MPTTETGGGARRVLVGLVVLGIAAAAGFAVLRGVGPLPDPEGCRVEVGDVTAELSLEQAENASLIAAIGMRRGLPARAVSIALAAAYQESDIENLDHGDRDSLGLFQQRPSMGWGTPEQIQDPVYATNKFFDALVKIDGYREMRITEAAQRVQRSGFPEAYADHADDARALASALTGYSTEAFTCTVDAESDLPAQDIEENGLTPRANDVLDELRARYGDVSLGGFAPGGVSTGHSENSAHYEGQAIDIFVRPINDANNRMGWAIAHYLVANAEALLIGHVIFDDRIWSAGARSERGWRDYDPGARSGDQQILEHRDHVHVDVLD